MTGQLALMMLLEQLHLNDIKVTSANTDGINVLVHDSMQPYVESLVNWWCSETGFKIKYNNYKSIHYRDVNNYFYHHADGYCSGIGIFAGDSIRKNPNISIVRDALFAHVKDGTLIEDTITECKDMRKFVVVVKVAGGAKKDDMLLGGTIRFYHANDTDTPILYVKNDNKVSNSDGCAPIMDFDDDYTVPSNIDHQYYINKAYQVMAQVGLLDDIHDLFDDQGDAITKEQFLTNVGVTKQMIRKYNIKVN